ncbi:ABC transporter ATP-binding protein [Ornithinibacillus contaminans]|uniref:ABC transporter ATP-binding protein n=1 Tax=Ornithinibacillus contaminans TaxID=694055 RepID=UPI00064DDBCD|nr:ABC transporter ATP-binding protein [Ornithinibacillus contaminans]
MIKLENVSKTFQSRTTPTEILNNVQIFIPSGSWVSIVGPSGVGKTTLLHVISGLMPPDSGQVLYENKNVYELIEYERRKLRRESIGFIFQDFKLLPFYSVLDNVVLPTFDKKYKKDLYKVARELLNMVGIPESLFKRLPEGLSGGEKQRVAIARALVADPNILICDEPTGNLDSENRNQIIDLLRDLNTQGKTIILVTHDMDAAKQADKVYHLMNGELILNEVEE